MSEVESTEPGRSERPKDLAEQLGSIGSEATAVSKSPKDVLALGQEIVRQLELADRGTVLARWMAHHVAEILTEIEETEGPEREVLEKQAVDLILRIWSQRRALPDPADPLAGYREAIAVLERLMPDSNPWAFMHTGSKDHVELLKEMFETLSRAVSAGLVLTCVSEPRAVTPSEAGCMEDEERRIIEMLEKWRQLVVPRRQEIRPRFVRPSGDPEQLDTEAAEAPSFDGGHDRVAERTLTDDTSLKLAIIEDIKRMQKQLALLLERWRSLGGDTLQRRRRASRIPRLVTRIYEVVQELEELFPGRRFTPDGHLVRSIGEVLADHSYGIELCPPSFPGHEGRTEDGKLLQVKATQRGSIGLRSEPEMLLVLQLSPDGSFHEVFNGPGSIAWEAAGPVQKNGQRGISVSKLARLMESVPRDQRIRRADRASGVPHTMP